MPTIREVAALANVSVATVSRVLNNDQTYKMKEETRQRVWQAVAQFPQPTSATRRTPPKPSGTENVSVGCVLSVTKDKYRDPYFMSVLSGVEQALEARGYSLAFTSTYYDLKYKDTLMSTFSKPVSGLILMETLDSQTYNYVRAKVPCCVGVDTLHTDIDNVGYDHFAAACQATRHLVDLGHRRIAYIGGSGLSRNIKTSRRYWGYRSVIEVAGLPVDDALVRDCLWDELICIEQVKAIMALSADRRPTAIFCGSDLMAIAALSGLYSLHIQIPNEVAVIGLSDIELSQVSCPPLSTIHVPTVEIGVAAVAALERRLKGGEQLPQSIYLPTELVKRSSTK